jgi:hypothetical protein
VLDRRVDETDAPFFDGVRVPALRLADHDRGVVDADHQALCGTARERGNRDPGTAAQFDDAVARVGFEQLHRPPVAPDVRRAMGEDPAFDMSDGPAGIVGLGDDAAAKTVWDVHVASRPLRVRSKSSGRRPRSETFVECSESPIDRGAG